MDAKGLPIRLFTTNRWVTGEAWYKARDVIKMIEPFKVNHAQPSWPTNRWVNGMVHLFWPQVILLLQARDASIEAWEKQHPGKDAFEDRDLEITSQADVDIAAQIAAGIDGLERELPLWAPDDDSYEADRPLLPQNLGAALTVLDRSQLYREQFGDLFVDYYLAFKSVELGRFEQHCEENGIDPGSGDVTQWEQNEYFDFF